MKKLTSNEIAMISEKGLTVKLDGEDEGTEYTGVENEENPGEYTVTVFTYGDYEISASQDLSKINVNLYTFGSENTSIVIPSVTIPYSVYNLLEYILTGEKNSSDLLYVPMRFPNGFRITAEIETPYVLNKVVGGDTYGFICGARWYDRWEQVYCNNNFFGVRIVYNTNNYQSYRYFCIGSGNYIAYSEETIDNIIGSNTRYSIDVSNIGSDPSDLYIKINGVALNLIPLSDINENTNITTRINCEICISGIRQFRKAQQSDNWEEMSADSNIGGIKIYGLSIYDDTGCVFEAYPAYSSADDNPAGNASGPHRPYGLFDPSRGIYISKYGASTTVSSGGPRLTLEDLNSEDTDDKDDEQTDGNA